MIPPAEGSGSGSAGNGAALTPALFLPLALPLIFFLLLALPLVSVPPSQNTPKLLAASGLGVVAAGDPRAIGWMNESQGGFWGALCLRPAPRPQPALTPAPRPEKGLVWCQAW